MRIIKVKYLIILFCVTISFAACSVGYENKDIENRLAKLDTEKLFTLDTVNTADWDSVYMLTPYIYGGNDVQAQLSKCDIPRKVHERLESISMFDTYNSLLFFKKQKLVNYVIIRRDVISFEGKGNKALIYSSSQKYKLEPWRKIIVVK